MIIIHIIIIHQKVFLTWSRRDLNALTGARVNYVRVKCEIEGKSEEEVEIYVMAF